MKEYTIKVVVTCDKEKIADVMIALSEKAGEMVDTDTEIRHFASCDTDK